MPMVGVIDPRGTEALPDPHQLTAWLTRKQLMDQLASDVLGESHWTYEMAHAAFENVQERGDMISTTALTGGCPRSEVLKRREDYVGDLNELWAALRGTLMHRTLELSTRKGAIAEVRFFTKVDGIEISGQPDMLTSEELIDYKVPADQKSIPMSYLYKSQTEQLMINAFIARHATRWEPDEDLPFDPREELPSSVGIVFIGPSKPKVMVYKESIEVVTPKGGKRKVRVPTIWGDKQVLSVVRPRMHILQNALKSYPEWPEPYYDPDTDTTWTAEDLWDGDQTWRCPGWPACKFATCLAKRERYTW